MTDFKAKMRQIRFRLGLCPRPRWGNLQRSPRPLAGFGGPLRGRGRGWAGEEEGKQEAKEREGEVEGREREGPKLLLNQGPSETCYATVSAPQTDTNNPTEFMLCILLIAAPCKMLTDDVNMPW